MASASANRRRVCGARAAAMLVAAFLTACGTTVTTAGGPIQVPGGQGPGALGAGSGIGGSGVSSAAAAPSGVRAVGAADASTSTGSRFDASGAGGQQLSAGTTGQAASNGNGPGVTAREIYFGAAYTKNQQAANQTVGAGGLDPGDQRRYYDAVSDDVNKHGGVAGRRLRPIYFGYDATTSQTTAQIEQAACSYFTQDHKVFVLLGGGSDLLRQCSLKHGVLDLMTSFSTATADTFRRFPNYVEISSMNLDRVGSNTVDGLARTDYFGRAPKVGLITWDQSNYRHAVTAGWLPTLRSHGLKAEVAYAAVAQGNSGVADSSSSVQSAVLRFRADGVDHVMISDGPAGAFGGTGLTLLFIREASSQQYFPRYGMNTTNSPQAGMSSGLWSADDIKDARAVTWGDGNDKADEGTTRNRNRLRCFAIMRTHGVQLDNDQKTQEALNTCDMLWFLKFSVEKGAGPVTVQAAIAGVDRTGRSYGSPTNYSTFFGPARHDGTAGARLSGLYGTEWRWLGKPYATS